MVKIYSPPVSFGSQAGKDLSNAVKNAKSSSNLATMKTELANAVDTFINTSNKDGEDYCSAWEALFFIPGKVDVKAQKDPLVETYHKLEQFILQNYPGVVVKNEES